MAEDKKGPGSKSLGPLARLRALTTATIYGTDQEFHDQNDSDIESIRQTINKIRRNYKQTTGEDILEFFNRFESEKAIQQVGSNRAPQNVKKVVNITDMVENPQAGMISDILFSEANRINLYENYSLIYDHIPQVAQALDTMVDNILSPDDFTKDVFNLFYDGKSVKGSNDYDESDDQVIRNLKDLTDRYEIEDKAPGIIRETLKKGDQFVAVLKLEKELNKMLTEQTSERIFMYTGSGAVSNVLTAKDIELTQDEISAFLEAGIFDGKIRAAKESLISESSNFERLPDATKGKLLAEAEVKALSEAIATAVNENFELSHDHHGLLEDTLTMRDDFKKEADAKASATAAFMSQYGGANAPTATAAVMKGITGEKESKDIKINGSIMKILDPDKVIKLALDDIVYGYYYIEKNSNDNFGQEQLTTAFGNQLNWDRSKSVGLGIVNYQQNDINMDQKQNLIVNTFVKTIGKKIDKKFVMKNKDFKDVIYSLVRQGYILDKKIKITYLSPDEVEHFEVNSSNDSEYGDSVYRKIFFIAKLYLAVLTSTLMQKISRSHDKRIYYIEVGLDNDSENAVQAFVRDVKNKEIKMDNMKDINTVLHYPGQFNDYYVPVVNGERPVEIDTLPGMDVDINNDFLEYLLKAMLSGMGVPATFLNYAEEVEFMRSLAMQNGKFVRQIIHFQKVFGASFSSLYRKLYRNEFMYKEKSSDKVSEAADASSKSMKERGKATKDAVDSVAYDKIVVSFPSPSSLNMTNLTEQINNSKDYIDFIVSTKLGDDAPESDKKVAREVIAKDVLPGIDWDHYDKLIDNALMTEKNKQALEAVPEGEEGGEAGGGGFGEEAGGEEGGDNFGAPEAGGTEDQGTGAEEGQGGGEEEEGEGQDQNSEEEEDQDQEPDNDFKV